MTFPYHRAVAPMMWVLVGLATVELFATHLLVALLWSAVAAAILSLATFGGILWLVAAILSFRWLPVRIAGETLVWRVGRLKRIDVPLNAIGALRSSWDGAALKAPGMANFGLIAYPNVIVDLVRPIPRGRRWVTALAHRLDDPAAFVAALEALGVGHD